MDYAPLFSVVFFMAGLYHLIGVICHIKDHGMDGMRLIKRVNRQEIPENVDVDKGEQGSVKSAMQAI